jgi:hypothetical protein
MKKSPK